MQDDPIHSKSFSGYHCSQPVCSKCGPVCMLVIHKQLCRTAVVKLAKTTVCALHVQLPRSDFMEQGEGDRHPFVESSGGGTHMGDCFATSSPRGAGV